MKNKFCKAAKSILLAAAAFCAVITLGKNDVKAQNYEQGNLLIGQTQTVTLSSKSYTDNFNYHFTTPKGSAFKVSVAYVARRKKDDNTSSDGGYIYTKAIVDYKDIWSDYIWQGDGFKTSYEFAYPGGKDCTVRISNISEYDIYTVQILVEKVDYSNFESEGNNTAGSANKLKNNKIASGIINKDDTDWFVFKAPKTGKYKFSVVDCDNEDGGYLYCAGYKSKTKLDKGDYIWQGQGWKKINTVKLKKGKKYYIKISESSREGIHYQVKVKKVK